MNMIKKTAAFVGVGLTIAIGSYYIGYKKGALTAKIESVPFDLSLYLMVYEMSSFIHSSEIHGGKTSWRPDNIRVMLYSTLEFYDKYKDSFQRIEEENPRFVKNITEARELAGDLDLVDLGSAINSEGVQTEEKKQ